MKQCPQCHRTYDEAITYCLDDGSLLSSSYDPEATQKISLPQETRPASSPLQPAQPQIIKQGVSPFFAYALVGLLAMLIAGGVVVIIYESKKDNSPPVTKAVAAPSPTASPDNTPATAQPKDQGSDERAKGREPSSISTPGRYPQGSTRLLTADDLADKTPWELKVMRNEIYARHGYIFKNPELKDYFERQSWYEPIYEDVTNLLSNVEKENIAFLKSYE